MTINIADAATNDVRCVGQEQVLCEGTFTIGAAGAVSASSVDDPALALGDDSGVGVHALTYPKTPYARIRADLLSSGLTVSEAVVTAKDAAAGTATLTLFKAGVATQAANGNQIHVTVIGKLV